MTEDKATFFDRIYPDISRRLHDLESEQKSVHYCMTEFRSHIKIMELTIDQYKKKIQRIEQALIGRGLESTLKGIF